MNSLSVSATLPVNTMRRDARWLRFTALHIQWKHFSGPSVRQMQILACPTSCPSHLRASLSPTAAVLTCCLPIGFMPCRWRRCMMHVAEYLISPVGLEHLDNTIETDRLSLVLHECVGGTKIGWWLLTVSMHCSSPVETKEQQCSPFWHTDWNYQTMFLFVSQMEKTFRQGAPGDILT